MIAEQPTYSAIQKRSLRSLQRALDSARRKAHRLLHVTVTGQRRRITIGLTRAISSLDQKLRDAEHHRASAAAMLDQDTNQQIASSAADVSSLLYRLVTTFVRTGHPQLTETLSTVSDRLISSYQEVSCKVAMLVVRRKKQPAVNTNWRSFLSNIESRGWHVPKDVQVAEDLRPDDISEAMLRQAQRPEADLLDHDTFAGLLRFPIVLSGSHISPAARTVCQEHEASYTVKSIFGRYVMIPDMVLVGVRSEAVQDQDPDHLDAVKFNTLLPWMRTQSPWHEAVLRDAAPVLQLRRYGGHYYCPVIPQQALQTRFELGEWSMLIASN